ncbi:MAG: hypothetical protein D6805_06880 [Planctomycetota bacterium]|nr:MAG: hypothetical protein D6805_06880 [Planctomycetota bacterium]
MIRRILVLWMLALGGGLHFPVQVFALKKGGAEKAKLDLWEMPFSLRSRVREFRFRSKSVLLVGDVQLRFRPNQAEISFCAQNMVAWFAKTSSKSGSLPLKKIYAEGGILVEAPRLAIRGEKLFYHLGRDRGVIEKARLYYFGPSGRGRSTIFSNRYGEGGDVYTRWSARLFSSKKGTPFYVEARRIHLQGLLRGRRKFWAREVTLTTCEFSPPHYLVGASSMEVVQTASGDYQIYLSGVRLQLLDSPFFYLPWFYWDTFWNPFIPRVKLGSSSKFGFFSLIKFRLPRVLGARTEVYLDHYQKKGLGGGGRIRYGKRQRRLDKSFGTGFPKETFGELDFYAIYDKGVDSSGFVYPRPFRYWVRWLHRQTLPGDIRWSAEYQRFSDAGVQLEYNERQAKEGRDVESYVYFQKHFSRVGWTLLAKYRQNDYLKEIEELPRVRWYIFSLPLFDFPARIYLDGEGEGGYFRLFAANTKAPSQDVLRLNQSLELSVPFSLWDLQVRPFLYGRATAYSEGAKEKEAQLQTMMGAGVTLYLHFWRIFGGKVKHIFTPEVTYKNYFHRSLSPTSLIAVDELEQFDRRALIEMALRNQIYFPERKLLDIYIRTSYFPLAKRDNLGRDFGLVELEGVVYPWRGFVLRLWGDHFLWKKSDLGVAFDFLWNVYTARLERWNVGLQLVDVGRMGMQISYRFQERISSILSLALQAKLNRKWWFRAVYQYDFRQGRLLQQTYTVHRKLHRWILSVSFARDEGEGNTTFSVNFSPAFLFKGAKSFGGYERDVVYRRSYSTLVGLE